MTQSNIESAEPVDVIKAKCELADKNAFAVLAWCYAHFPHDAIKLSTSFGAEGMVLMHMLAGMVQMPKIFTIDTGRNFQQTYDVWQRAVERYHIPIEAYYPDPDDIKNLTGTQGPNLFYASVENRKQCCFVRKVKPLGRALADARVWIAGLRREQSHARKMIPVISWVEEHKVYKVCPLWDWSEQNVWEFVRSNDVPYNALYDEGYPTVGCAPCCRPVGRMQDIRAGRWWWESDEQKECGIHIEDGKVRRTGGNPNFSI